MSEQEKSDEEQSFEAEPNAKLKVKAENPKSGSKIDRFKTWYVENKKLSIPATIILLIIILAAVPFSRYALAGTVMKKDFSVKVLDDTSSTAVSGAQVTVGVISATTNAAGQATLKHISVGPHKFLITKKYYKDRTVSLTVPIVKEKAVPSVTVTATGRQVKVTVTNAIDKSALADVDISVAGTTAKTDSSGMATLVLPTGVSQQQAKLSLNGYNDADVTVKVSDSQIINNQFGMTPSGKVYFLSKLSGTIDVVKTNLDGTDRQTVLAGTGKEDNYGTVLLASKDWKYLVLLSQRAGDSPSLYMIDTSDDSLSVIDEGNVSFNLIGWDGHYFIYSLNRNTSVTQPHSQAIKSYNAATKQLVTLDQTNAETQGYNSAGETYDSFTIADKSVIYSKSWSNSLYTTAGNPVLNGKQAAIYSIGPDGKNATTLKAFDMAPDKFVSIDSIPNGVNGIYFSVTDPSGTSYYVYADGKVSSSGSLSNQFSNYYNDIETYLQSPSGTQTFWSDARDGKNTLFIGDSEGQNGKQIATLSDYKAYGWYSDNYLLVSKNDSELYIMDKGGKQTPVKITDYHKPAQSFNGYGGGYGGL